MDPRTTTVNIRIAQLDRAISDLQKVRQFLTDALLLKPAVVDGCQWYDFEAKTFETADQLKADFTDKVIDPVYLALTGKSSDYWCILWQFQNGYFDRKEAQREIDQWRKTNPAEAAELQALVDRTGVQDGL